MEYRCRIGASEQKAGESVGWQKRWLAGREAR